EQRAVYPPSRPAEKSVCRPRTSTAPEDSPPLHFLDASASSAISAEAALDPRKWPLQERPQLDAPCWRTNGEKLPLPLQAQPTKRRASEPVQLSGASRYCGTQAPFSYGKNPGVCRWTSGLRRVTLHVGQSRARAERRS